MTVRVEHGDSREVLPTLTAESIDACVTDPPYALVSIQKRFGKPGSAPAQEGRDGLYRRASAGFMGKTWDTGETAFDPAFWSEVLRVLKPGGHLLAFGGTRSYHRLVCAIEDAGFEIRDTIMYLYGSGFPKAHNLKNKPEIFCSCGGFPVPYGHDKAIPEHDVRPVCDADLPPPLDPDNQRREVLFEGLSESRAPERRASRTQSQADAREQPGVEGRALHRTGEGLRDGADAGASEGTEERLRAGAHLGSGENARPGADRNGGSPPQGFEPGEQQAGQSEGVCGPSVTLGVRALRHGGCCPRCSKLTKAFRGFSTALKPAVEPIVLARKPLIGTVAANVLEHGCGALNVDGCRVAANDKTPAPVGQYGGSRIGPDGHSGIRDGSSDHLGRWPANVIHDGSDEVLEAFAKFGTDKGQAAPLAKRNADKGRHTYGAFTASTECDFKPHDGLGSPARFFYAAKASKKDRAGSKHPTVKPVDLMAYLCRLVTPPGGTVLDPFAGSGATGAACLREGFKCILIEREAEYIEDINRRFAHVKGEDTALFAGSGVKA